MKKVYVVSFSLLTVVNILLFISLIRSQNTNEDLRFLNSVFEYKNEEVNTSIIDIRKNYQNSFLINNTILLGEEKLIDLEGKENSLSEILNYSKEILVIRINESFCSSCIINCLSILSSNLPHTNVPKVIIISSDRSFNIADYGVQHAKFKVFYHPGSVFIHFDKQKIPYMFTVDSSLICHNGFALTEGNNDFVMDYIHSFIRSK